MYCCSLTTYNPQRIAAKTTTVGKRLGEHALDLIDRFNSKKRTPVATTFHCASFEFGDIQGYISQKAVVVCDNTAEYCRSISLDVNKVAHDNRLMCCLFLSTFRTE